MIRDRVLTIGKKKISLIKGVIGLVLVLGGLVVGVTQLPKLLAFNDTTQTWNFNVGTSGTYTFDTNYVTVNSNGAEPASGANKITNPSFTTDVSSWTISAVGGSTTPAGWIVVPGNQSIGTSDFLVMKYDAKCANSSTTGVGLTAPADTTYHVYRDDGAATPANNCTAANNRVVTSLASGYPITYLYQTEANTRCGTIAMGVGSSAHLITNNEWITVANNAEQQPSNWSGNAVGSGYLYAGHNDNSPAYALPASTNDAYRAAFTNSTGDTENLTTATNLTNGSSGSTGNQVRNLFLSNGQVIWDFGGNVYNWTNDTVLRKQMPVLWNGSVGSTAWNWADYASGGGSIYVKNYKTGSPVQQSTAEPLSSSYPHNYKYGIGQLRSYSDEADTDTTVYGFIRGGTWYYGSIAGAFTLYLYNSPSARNYSFGFRCASDSVAISQSFSSNSLPLRGGYNQVAVGSLTDAKITQSVNVGDTNTYDFSAYVYGNGETVTADVAQLYYNNGTLLTTYTDVGSGWYKLRGTVTGVNEAKDFGVIVRSGKTVKVDDFTLSKIGTYSIFNKTAYENVQVHSWDSFTADVGSTNDAGVTYQVCEDDGTTCETNNTWKYWNGSSWALALTSSDTNTAATISSHLGSFTTETKKMSVKAFMTFGGSDVPTIRSITIGLTTDTEAPGNISTIQMKKNSGSGSTMPQNEWTNDSSPYFSWNEAFDNTGGVGIMGYCLYLSLDDTSPNLKTSTSSLLPGNTNLDSVHISSANTQCGNGSGFLVSTKNIDFGTETSAGSGVYKYRGSGWLTSSTKGYYLYIKAVDNAGNIANDPNVSFHFRFDNTPPTNPSYISLPADYVSSKQVTFLWASSGSDGPKDGASEVFGLQYRIGTSGVWYGSNHTGSQGLDDILVNNGNYTTIENPDYNSIIDGTNLIYLRTWDVAGNVSTSYVSGALKINTQSPSKPKNLVVTPDDNTTNSYSFEWEDPASVTGQASKLTFCYSINTLPTAISCTFTGAAVHSLSADAFATQPGTNTFYLVARDEAGNINYDNYESVTFTYSGSAPGIPRNADLSDISIKATSNWKLTLSWDTPESIGAGVASYKVYRSINSASCSSDMSGYTLLGTTAGTSYSDTGLSQKTYYYCIKACDSANNCSAVSTTVNKYPTGKYYTSASLTSGPNVSSITTKKAVITWSTDRNSDSKVSYGTGSNSYYTEEPSNSSQVTDHTINLNNLSPGTTYYFKTKWTDEDGNTGSSEEKSFTTTNAPNAKEVVTKNIGLSGVIIQFTSTNASKVKIYFGKTTSFGGVKEVNTASAETTYTAELTGLDDGSKYFYKINTFDADGNEYEGNIYSFETLPKPRISSVRLQQVSNTAQTAILVTWTTNTEVSSILTYWPEGDTSVARDEVNVALTKGNHQLIIRGLLPSESYSLQVKGRDKIGNEAVSETQRFTTAEDTRPPEISAVQVEGQPVPAVNGTGQESTAQLIVTWNTDEPATSQVEFGEGSGTTYAQKTQEDDKLTSNHLVIISNLSPSKVYHLRVLSKDKAQNLGQGIDTVTIAPKATANALDLVVTNLGEVFGFLGGINK